MDKSKKVMNLLEGFYDQPLPGGDEVGTFWVVNKPTDESVLEDILFSATVQGMMLQSMGGLRGDQILGIFKDEKRATRYAKKVLGSGTGVMNKYGYKDLL